MIPSIGRIVHYKLTPQDAEVINARRLATPDCPLYGNTPAAGDVFPAMIVRCWGAEEGSMVNLQVFLDGNDAHWVTSRSEAADFEGHWSAPPRV